VPLVFPPRIRTRSTVALADRFEHPSTQLAVRADLALVESYDAQIAALEAHLVKSAKVDDPATFAFLRTVPGIGPILGLVMLYEIDSVTPFPGVGNLLSYARLVTGTHESAGKVKGVGGRKMGSEATGPGQASGRAFSPTRGFRFQSSRWAMRAVRPACHFRAQVTLLPTASA
jgi:transposase